MEAKVHASLCPLNFLGKISMRHVTVHYFHIEVPLPGFKSSITHVTLGKTRTGHSFYPDNSTPNELFLQ